MTSKQTAADTLSLLESRLRRLDFVLNGDNNQDELPTNGKAKASAAVRLRALERSLHSLVATSPNASEVLALLRRHPDLFHSNQSSDAPTTLPTTSLASLVLAHSPLFHSTSARLAQLQDLTIPDTTSATKLIDLQPRIEQARVKQVAQAKEFTELRVRSAKAVEAWYEGGSLSMDEQWAGWEERLRDAEILVRRREAAKKREDEAI